MGLSRSTTRYAKTGDLNIAYQVAGDADVDLVVVAGWLTHIDLVWEAPGGTEMIERASSFARVIMFDKRGVGLSDRVAVGDLPTLEERIDDLRAVLDAVGSTRAALFAIHEAGPMCLLFAATYPERVSALVLYGSSPVGTADEKFPWAPDAAGHAAINATIEQRWGEGNGVRRFAPSRGGSPEFRDWMGRYERQGASPGAAVALSRMYAQTDAREVLPAVRVPTLVLHRTGDLMVPIEAARWTAAQIPGAKLVELPGEDHWIGTDPDQIFGEVEEFLTGSRSEPVPERQLLTLVFTDVVGSTEQVAALGDGVWAARLDRHDQAVRGVLDRFRGREVNTTGDGFLAAFDGPARAVRAASEMGRAVATSGLKIRAGVHTGEVELRNDDVAGIAVHVAARIASLAGTDEVLVSQTVVDLVAGSGLVFEDRGEQQLKGVDRTWRLFSLIG